VFAAAILRAHVEVAARDPARSIRDALAAAFVRACRER
jgi:hypothetical protein